MPATGFENQDEYVRSLVEEITTATQVSAGEVLKNAGARAQALRASRQLTAILENPIDVALEVAFLNDESKIQPAYNFCTRVAIDLGLFPLIVQNGQMSATDLAVSSGGEELLIVRIMRVLSAMGFVDEVGERVYAATPITNALTRPPIQAGLKHYWDQGVSSLVKLPEYLRKNGYKCPTDPRDGAFQYAFQTNLETFEYWGQSPEVLSNFNTFMGGIRAARANWIDWFPVQQQLLDGSKGGKDDVLLIDIAGGRGHDLETFRRTYPSAPGRLVLQDLPKVIDDIKDLSGSIERIEYDFLTPQPIKGARAYFFHFIFHDWSDDVCRTILRNTALAMEKDYSKLLLNELILPDTNCPLFPAGMDLNMMALHAGMERTKSQWRELLDSAGFEILNFWLPPGDGEGVIEAVFRGTDLN